jgi:hypothetical protein
MTPGRHCYKPIRYEEHKMSKKPRFFRRVLPFRNAGLIRPSPGGPHAEGRKVRPFYPL